MNSKEWSILNWLNQILIWSVNKQVKVSLSIQSIKDKETGNYFNSFISLVSTYKRRRYQIPTASDLLALKTWINHGRPWFLEVTQRLKDKFLVDWTILNKCARETKSVYKLYSN